MFEEKSTHKRLKLLPNLFRKADAEKVAPHTGMFLTRALNKGLIHRINRGNYINSFFFGFPGVEEIACFLRPPAYVTCEWALNFHGITLQAPFVCTAATLSFSVGKSREIEYQGITIEFSKISPKLFFGYATHKGFYMATPEKALLDTLYYRGNLPVADELELEGLDQVALIEMAKKFPSPIIRKMTQILR
jgi:predicted transcriptional regulator of viral defense system